MDTDLESTDLTDFKKKIVSFHHMSYFQLDRTQYIEIKVNMPSGRQVSAHRIFLACLTSLLVRLSFVVLRHLKRDGARSLSHV
jgi:hypothetical protein